MISFNFRYCTITSSQSKKLHVFVEISLENCEENAKKTSDWPTARSRESCNRSVRDGCLKLPLLVKVEVFESNVIVTPHSLSLRCFLSKHAAKAQPTAWLKRSPCKNTVNNKRWTRNRRNSRDNITFFCNFLKHIFQINEIDGWNYFSSDFITR